MKRIGGTREYSESSGYQMSVYERLLTIIRRYECHEQEEVKGQVHGRASVGDGHLSLDKHPDLGCEEAQQSRHT